MPTGKKTTIRRRLSGLTRRAGGSADRGERAMREAIGLLFAIYGKLYSKKHPDFITPTVDEFFAYVDDVGAEARAALTPKKRTQVHRALPGFHTSIRRLPIGAPPRSSRRKKRMAGGGMLERLLNLIIGPGDTLCQKVFRILAVSLLAIMVASFLSIIPTYMSGAGATYYTAIQSTIADPAYANSLADPLRWICGKMFPSGLTYFDGLFSSLQTFITGGFGTLNASSLSEVGSMSLKAMGFLTTFICRKLVESTYYHRIIVMPLSRVLYTAGMESCDDVYRSASAAGAGRVINWTIENFNEMTARAEMDEMDELFDHEE